MKRLLAAFAVVVFTCLPRLHAQDRSPEADATVVVFNSRDPASQELAKYYAGKRHIAADHVVGVDCTTEEEINRAEYDANIAEPLRKIFTERGWWKLDPDAGDEMRLEANKIRFIALIRGIPLKIPPVASYKGDVKTGPEVYSSKNEACVDSELASLGFFSHTISGALGNPYYRSFKRITDANIPALMLVCRLDGPTDAIVRGMIDDSIETEKTGLWGFAYIDSRNIKEGGLAEGDKWLLNIVEDAKKHGIPVIHDNGPDVFPEGYPMNYAAFYYGWYADNVTGPFARPDFRFTKGAVACHIHSFSAATLRDANKNWAGPLLAHGAAAVLGNVYEPFLSLTSNLDIFQERLQDGFTFAESAYASVKVVSWMNTFIGDPLYRPFKVIEDNPNRLPKPISEWAAYRNGAILWFKGEPVTSEKLLTKSGRDLSSGIIFESLGLLQAGQNDFIGALDSFQQARVFYTNPDDIIRSAIHEISILRAMGKNPEAHKLAQKIMSVYPASEAAPLLKKIDDEITAAPTQSPHN